MAGKQQADIPKPLIGEKEKRDKSIEKGDYGRSPGVVGDGASAENKERPNPSHNQRPPRQ